MVVQVSATATSREARRGLLSAGGGGRSSDAFIPHLSCTLDHVFMKPKLLYVVNSVSISAEALFALCLPDAEDMFNVWHGLSRGQS